MATITFKHPTHKFHYPTETTMKLSNLTKRETELSYSYWGHMKLTWNHACNHHPQAVLMVGIVVSIIAATVLANILP